MAEKYFIPFKPDNSIKICKSPFHKEMESLKNCIDFSMFEGTPVLAARAGVVVARESRYSKNHQSSKYIDRTNYVIIQHLDGEVSVYAHLKWHSIRVAIGQKVKRGKIIGLSGQTGYATYPHLHFGVYDKEDNNIKVLF